MRVISGTAKGKRLKLVPGDTTRPIMDRVKENLFNILGPDYVIDARWLDLFGGTGQVGIEALSRGAAHVVFLDLARAAIRTMHDNLRDTNLAENATVIQTDALAYLGSFDARAGRDAPTGRLYDIIYVAPPQYAGIWLQALKIIDKRVNQLLLPDGMAIVQIDPKEYSEPTLAGLQLADQRTYGNTMLCFYEPIAEDGK